MVLVGIRCVQMPIKYMTYDTFRGKKAVLFINLLGKGLTQEINGDGGSISWPPGVSDIGNVNTVASKT